MIGDREHDVRAAHANGVRAIGVLWGYGSRDGTRRRGRRRVWRRDPRDLPDALSSLGR